MTKLDDKLRPKVKALLARLGKLVTYTAIVRTRDATSGDTLSVETVHSSILATPPTRYMRRLADGDAVKRGDVRISFAALDLPFTPASNDQVEFDSTTWRVVSVTPVYSGELEVLWTLQLRR